MTAPSPVALGLLWQMGQNPDDEQARRLRSQAYEAGATAADIARWWGARDALIADSVQVIGGAA